MIKFFTFILLLCILNVSYCECLAPKIHLSLIRTYKNTAAEESIEIYEGTPLKGSKEFSADGVGLDFKEFTYDLCLNPVQHTLVALDGNNDGWQDGSYFVLKTFSGVTLLKGTLDLYTRKEWTFYPYFTVSYNSIWKYMNTNQDNTNWKSSTFDDSDWLTYESGHFPRVSTLTRYYRYAGQLPSNLDEFVMYEIGVNNKEGIIIYMNGIEIYRYNINHQSPTFITPASSIDNYVVLRKKTTSIPESLYNNTSVTIAVEIHSDATIIPLNDSFNMYFIPLYGPCNTRSQDGTVTSSDSSVPSLPAANAFDGDIQTLWKFTTLPATIDYIYPDNRLEWINSYTIYTSTNSNQYDISSWKLLGSNDGITFTLLDYKTDILFDTLNSYLTFPLTTNSVSFNQYRFVILSTRSAETPISGEIGEIFLNACLQTHYTSNTLLYSQTDYSFIINMSNVFLIPLTNGFTSFTTDLPLPKGLTINTNSGIISGIPNDTIDSTSTIKISATNVNNIIISVTLHFNIKSCVSPYTRVSVMKYNSNKGTGADETFSLYTKNQELIDTQNGVSSLLVDLYIQKYDYCLLNTDYILLLTSTDSKGWARGSSIEFYFPFNNSTLLRTSLLNTKSQQIPFSIMKTNPTSITYYSSLTTLPPTTWITSTSQVEGFNTYNQETHTIQSESKLWFFHMVYSSILPESAQGFEITFQARAGAVLYVNGNEVYRVNLPSSAIALNTVATSGLSYNESPISFIYTGSMHILRTNMKNEGIVIGLILVGTSSYQSSIVDMSCTFRYLYETQIIPRTWNIDTQESNVVSSDTRGNNLFDQNYYTRFIGYLNKQYPSPQWIEGHYRNNRAEAVNAYCIVNGYDHTQYDPLSFVFEGSHDGNTYTELDREIDIVWDSRTQRQCYYLFNQYESYQYFRFSILKIDTIIYPNNDRFAISQIEFYLYDYDTIIIPPLAYSSSHVEGFIGANLISTFPNHELWNNFEITPVLPMGLSIDTGTGVISGIPTIELNQSYNISAMGPQGISSCLIQIKIEVCGLPKGLLTIDFQGMGQNSYQNGFELRDYNNILKYSYAQFPAYLDKWSINYCLEGNVYNLVMIDNRGDGWDTGSYTVYSEENSIVLTGTVVYGERRKVVRFNSGYLVYSDTNKWSYLQNGEIPPSTWIQKTYNTNTWAIAKSSAFTNLKGTTQYYRSTFTVPYLGKYASWEVHLCYSYGAIIYVNEVVIYKYNLPTTVSSSTSALETSTYSCTSITNSVVYSSLIQGTNVIAIELHGYESSPGVVSIDTKMSCSIKLHMATHEGIFNGIVSTSHPGYKDDYYDETEDKAFDHTTSTKYYGISTCVDQYVQYSYNKGQSDYINSWSFSRGNMDERVPTDLTLLGSNDNITWSTLHWKKDIQFGDSYSVGSTLKWSFYNEQSYRMYRIVMNGNCKGGFEVSEIQFSTNRIDNYCEAIGEYKRQVYDENSYVSCGPAYSGYKSRYCNKGTFENEINSCFVKKPQRFEYLQSEYIGSSMSIFSTSQPILIAAEYNMTITPSLPSGLFLNTRTGEISGIPLTTIDKTQFVIRVHNNKGYLDTTISIQIDKPTPIAIIIWIIIFVIIIIIIIVICIIFNRRRKLSTLKRKQHKNEVEKLTKALI